MSRNRSLLLVDWVDPDVVAAAMMMQETTVLPKMFLKIASFHDLPQLPYRPANCNDFSCLTNFARDALSA